MKKVSYQAKDMYHDYVKNFKSFSKLLKFVNKVGCSDIIVLKFARFTYSGTFWINSRGKISIKF